ncbi:2OG-Fe(II) oxygenase [Amorphus orientalis]|uniref:Fe2OG dioxygenase domain-containing protein n=1 Tax=Amorphus orientalis TaxID=649198 RepID=A0AAE4ARF8_9HYPH|nr:2OG-Fe(II) oxygenase [Amorphus orientalis]MDQ0313978.1 hypothetical protein [Amorphus orientalis]
MTRTPTHAAGPVAERIAAIDWDAVRTTLDAYGAASLGPILMPEECAGIAALYADPDRFRSKVVMERVGFGQGEYQYFDRPLPDLVEALRQSVYPHLVPTANAWAEALGRPERFPDTLDAFLDTCHAAGQTRPTPLVLTYREGDYNRLHQDLYGEIHFPLQMVILLSRPGVDFEGGAFVMTEQKPRAQSRAEVLTPVQGEAIVFGVNHRPGWGKNGAYRLVMRHGVSRLTSGARTTLGIIFHDAT